jgi:hypothetical protein
MTLLLTLFQTAVAASHLPTVLIFRHATVSSLPLHPVTPESKISCFGATHVLARLRTESGQVVGSLLLGQWRSRMLSEIG